MEAIHYNYQDEVDQLKDKLNVDFVGLAMPSELILQKDKH